MRRQGWWTRFVLWRQGAVAVAVLLAGILQAMHRYDIKTEWGWAHSKKVLFASAAIAGGLVLINTFGDVVSQRRSHAGESRRLDIHKPVIAALVAVSSDTRLPITEFGANVFLVKKGVGYRWGHKDFQIRSKTLRIGRIPRLDRVERIRLSDSPAMSDVPWTQGKGVIGDCWQNGRPEYVHWAPLAKRWNGKNITEEQWATKIKPEDKAGFSREEFMKMVGKYAEIKAVPIKNGNGTAIGVVALDRAWRSNGPQEQVLNTEAVEDTITSTAAVLQNVLGGG